MLGASSGLNATHLEGRPDTRDPSQRPHHPWAVAHLASLGALGDISETEAPTAASARRGLPLLAFSSSLVFDGQLERSYVESDAPCPTDEHGSPAAEIECAVLALDGTALAVRTGPVFGGPPWAEKPMPTDSPGPLDPASLASPSFLPDLAHAALDLLIDGERGVWHLANGGQAPWGQVAARLAEVAGTPGLEGLLSQSGASRRTLAVASDRGWVMPPLAEAITRFAHDRGRPVIDRIAAG